MFNPKCNLLCGRLPGYTVKFLLECVSPRPYDTDFEVMFDLDRVAVYCHNNIRELIWLDLQISDKQSGIGGVSQSSERLHAGRLPLP